MLLHPINTRSEPPPPKSHTKWRTQNPRSIIRSHGNPRRRATAARRTTTPFSGTSAAAAPPSPTYQRPSAAAAPDCRRFGSSPSRTWAWALGRRRRGSTRIWRSRSAGICTISSWARCAAPPTISRPISCSEKVGSVGSTRVTWTRAWGPGWRLSPSPSSFSILKAYRATVNGW